MRKIFLSLLVTFIFGIVISVVVHKTVSADWRYTVDVCIGSLLVFFSISSLFGITYDDKQEREKEMKRKREWMELRKKAFFLSFIRRSISSA